MEKCKDDLQREFYIQMTMRYGWTKRILTNFIEAQTYEKYLLNQTNFDMILPEGRRMQAKLAVKDKYYLPEQNIGKSSSESIMNENRFTHDMELTIKHVDENMTKGVECRFIVEHYFDMKARFKNDERYQ